MKWAFFTVVGLSIVSTCRPSYSAQRIFSWENAEGCQFYIRFDSKKQDQRRIENTVDFIFTGYVFNLPSEDVGLAPGAQNAERYAEACEHQVGEVASRPVIDLPGIEEYRKIKQDQLTDMCHFEQVIKRAKVGNAAALRDYEPSAAHCARFVDALEGKIDITAVWHDVVNSNCREATRPDACRAAWLERETPPDASERVRRDVLDYGWRNCSATYLRANETGAQAEAKRAKLETELRTRFRIRSDRCGD